MTYNGCLSGYCRGTLPGQGGGGLCRERAHTRSPWPRPRARGWRSWRGHIRHRIETSCARRSSCTPPRVSATTRSALVSIRPGRSSASGASASSRRGSPAWTSDRVAAGRPCFPPSVVVAVKALACELPHESGLPLSRFSIPEIQREILARGLAAFIGETTLWRWLSEDAIRPWTHRSWIFPRDPAFKEKAG